jgi:peptidoglycan hydrolase-like protein with peptidoglycan-binding domain
MRLFAGVLVLVVGAGPALAQSGEYAPRAAAQAPSAAAAKPKPAAKPGGAATVPKTPPKTARNIRDSYEAIPLAERIKLQSDLIWAGYFNGLANGEFSDRMVAAVKAFQTRNRSRDTGVLNPQERAALSAAARPLQNEVGWRIANDERTGARLGLPAKFAPQTAAGRAGTRWTSAQGQLQIETFRLEGTTINAAYEQQRKEPPERRVEYNVLRPDFFVVSGRQGLKKFYVRGVARDSEVRGISVLYDQAMEGTMDTVVVAMSSAFVPFPASDNASSETGQPRRKVEYATGLVVSAAGHLVTDRRVVDGCHVISVPGLGPAERVAEDKASELVLLRVHGARGLVPLGLSGAPSQGETATLVGIADPQTQGGNAAVTAPAARLGPSASLRALEPAPALGFSGAAALDGQGRFAGMVLLKPSVVAGPGPSPQAALVPAERVMSLLKAHDVAPAPERPGIEPAKSSVVRIICVRK